MFVVQRRPSNQANGNHLQTVLNASGCSGGLCCGPKSARVLIRSLRAAYFAQELLSTFGTSIGEVALIPATGGVFTVYVTHAPSDSDNSRIDSAAKEILIWDRKAENGFPETKILKQRLRNLIEPEKNLGHSDTPSSKTKAASVAKSDGDNHAQPPPVASSTAEEAAGDCKDCA